MVSRRSSALFFTALAAIFAVAPAMTMPEPSDEPSGPVIPMYPDEPILVLWKAGANPEPVKILKHGTNVCPKDFPTGFTIECRGPKRVKRVVFFINNKRVMKQYRAPYTLAGDRRDGFLKPFTNYRRVAWIRCRLFGLGKRTNVKAKLQFHKC